MPANSRRLLWKKEGKLELHVVGSIPACFVAGYIERIDEDYCWRLIMLKISQVPADQNPVGPLQGHPGLPQGTMNTIVEVKPCPFCGQQPSITINETELSMAVGDETRQFKATIACNSLTCRVRPSVGPTVFTRDEISNDAEKTRNAVVEVWNNRPG